MNKYYHILYICVILIILFIRPFTQKDNSSSKPKKSEIKTITIEKECSTNELEYDNVTLNNTQDKNISTQKEAIKKVTSLPKNTSLKKISSILKELDIDLDKAELEELISNKNIFRLIEENLIDNISGEDTLDIVEEYLYANTKEVSIEFISELTQNLQHMEENKQVQFLTIMQDNTIASRGYGREEYEENLINNIKLFSLSNDEKVRLASLNVLIETSDEKEILKNTLVDFNDDSSTLIQARLLLLKENLAQD